MGRRPGAAGKGEEAGRTTAQLVIHTAPYMSVGSVSLTQRIVMIGCHARLSSLFYLLCYCSQQCRSKEGRSFRTTCQRSGHTFIQCRSRSWRSSQ